MLPALPFDAASLLDVSARRWRDKVALHHEGGSTRYGELHDRVARLAAALQDQGVRSGDRVVVLIPNGARFVESWWAVISIGAIVVPVNHRSASEELHATIGDCGPRCIIADGARFAAVEPLCRLPEMQGVILICTDGRRAGARNYEDLIARSRTNAGRTPLELSRPCAIYYTAGTTGRSKGVVRSHLSVAWGLAMIAQRMSPDDVLLARAPMAHAGGSLTGPFAVLIAGGTLVIPAQTDAQSLLGAVQRHGVTRCYVHPVLSAKAMFAALDEGRHDLDSLRLLQWTAGPLPEAIRSELFRRFPHLPLETTYGMSEVSNIASYLCDTKQAKPANCVGYAWPGSEIGILAHSGELMPAGGGEGEVLVRSPTAMSGYWNAPDLTANATRDGWVHTGDIGRLDGDGALLLTGRIKEAINTGGMTVHAAEVEHALAAHADVADVAVFGLPHPQWEEAVTAVVARRVASTLSEAALIEHCRTLLSNYKLPKKIIFVSELPRNASNKVDKRALRARYAAASSPD
jgi:acyl-coenzyme A synthetase/AMP-(fatty) acid ligase